MNLYLLTFKQGNTVINAWHEAVNAGEAINMVEEQGVEVIKTVKIKNHFVKTQVKHGLPDLLFWLSLLEDNSKAKQQEPKGIVKITI